MAHLIQQACFLTAPKDIGTVVPCFNRALDPPGPDPRPRPTPNPPPH